MLYECKGTVELIDRSRNWSAVDMEVKDLLDEPTVEIETIERINTNFVPMIDNEFYEESEAYVDEEEMKNRAYISFVNMLNAEANKQGYELHDYEIEVQEF